MRSKQAAEFASGWLMRPAVAITLLYGGAVACWFIFLAATITHPTIWHEGEHRIISSSHYWLFTAANALLAVWLLWSASAALRAPRGLRRGQVAGVVLALLFLLVLQIGAQGLHRAWPAPVEDHAGLDAHFESLPMQQRELVRELRQLLAARLPEHRERLIHDVLHVRGRGVPRGSLTARADSVVLLLQAQASTTLPPPPEAAPGPGAELRAPAANRLIVTLDVGASPAERAAVRAYLTAWIDAARGAG